MDRAQVFHKKPGVVEAIQWTGSNFDALAAFCKHPKVELRLLPGDVLGIQSGDVYTSAKPGDWVVKGHAGFYARKEHVFWQTYEGPVTPHGPYRVPMTIDELPPAGARIDHGLSVRDG